MYNTSDTDFNLLDFGIVGEQLSIQELLHTSYMRGKADALEEMKRDFTKNLQSAAHSSSLLKSKLNELDIHVKEMYLKVIDLQAFKCLVLLAKEDFYEKAKRRTVYQISEKIHDTNNQIQLDFSIMSHDEAVAVEHIIADGFLFKYGS